MSNDDPSGPQLPDLNAYRDGKRKERFVRLAVDKAVTVRDLLTNALAGFNTAAGSERQIIGFALNDVLQHISREEIDSLRTLLKKLATTRRFD